MKKVNGHEIINLFETLAPKELAEDGDPIGLQIGRLNQKVDKVMVTLDVLEEVVDEAVDKGVKLIIAHHPPLFRPLKTLKTDTVQGRMIEKLIKNDISVYAAHTNLDVARGGVNDLLAEALELKETRLLLPTFKEKLKKLAVFVPEEAADKVRKAMGDAGAGHIGNYSHCTFTSKGTGRFLPGEGTDPYIGEKGKLEAAAEVKVETIYPDKVEKKILKAMVESHPYEEAAYDILPLENDGETLGLGRIGKLSSPMSLKEFALYVKEKLNVSNVRVTGALTDSIQKVAVLGGDGNKFIHTAKFSGADAFVTGDLYYHTAHDAMMLGLNVVDAGHHIEKVMKEGVARWMAEKSREKGLDVEYLVSEVNTDPFTFL
ncbi:Nif3-like dinuclear metal center hexameric protein [Bacillus salacetis]|uniref:GTP cyclohydrolase 1 type 2 homolog n=1 Tax=Bacillus salacetis TaxID=2315464 RepID=A0A3A1QTH8_9BACI|nr:Nif3-like dinuclear metal center hexameric protein [Bacillus salacetis]RIW31026.1 Nif3-like dinuclear metal center hexameric protein [Bacillus salacetis]